MKLSKTKLILVLILTAYLGIFPHALAETYTFTRDLYLGSEGPDVADLQRFLNGQGIFVNSYGLHGGPGYETQYFGPLTQRALITFQERYKSDILLPYGNYSGTGYFDAPTRAKIGSILAGGAAAGGSVLGDYFYHGYWPGNYLPQWYGIGGGYLSTQLLVASEPQPSPFQIIAGASRVPFTRFRLDVFGNQPVTVQYINIQVTGLGDPEILSRIMLLDANGNQVGNAVHVNYTRQTTMGAYFTLQPNQSAVYTLAADINTDLRPYQGQTVGISVTGVQVGADRLVSGQFPIKGTEAQVSSIFQWGAAVVQTGILGNTAAHIEPNKQYYFASIRVTAPVSDDIYVRSIRWSQKGSVPQGNLSGIATVADGVLYGAYSTDGRYYTSNFSYGVRISRGESKEFYLQGYAGGGMGSTVKFDIDNASDINISGQNYYFNILPQAPFYVSSPPSGNPYAVFTPGYPFFSGAMFSI